MDLEKHHREIRRARRLHYLLMTAIFSLFVLCALAVSMVLRMPAQQAPIQNTQPVYDDAASNEKAPAKALPGFIVDKMKPDDLKDLKP